MKVKESRLEDKNRQLIVETCDEIVNYCKAAVEEHHDHLKNKGPLLGLNAITQKSKAILITFRNVQNINAETVISRVQELKILYEYLNSLSMDEIYQWPIPVDNIRPTLNWSCKWSAQDDSMLLVGAFLHGFGNWEQIQKDERLNLQGKFSWTRARRRRTTAPSRSRTPSTSSAAATTCCRSCATTMRRSSRTSPRSART